MKYMMFIKHSEKYRNEQIPQGLMDAMGVYVGDAFKAGWLVDTAGLLPTSEGTRVTLANGKITVTDGPFTESKEIVGGYAIVQVKSKEEALKIGREFVELHQKHWPGFDCESELRPLEDFDAPPAA